MKLKELYKKYTNWVVVILVCLLAMKSCQSCSRNQALNFIEYNHNQSELVLKDSIMIQKDIIVRKDKSIDSLTVELRNSQLQTQLLREEIGELRDMNRHFQSTNRTLITSNNELINKTEQYEEFK